MTRIAILLLALTLASPLALARSKKSTKSSSQTPLDVYVKQATARQSEVAPATPGAIWITGSRMADAARDVRASQVDDIVTVIVAEQASAVSTGTTKTSRQSSTKNSISALAGLTRATGPFANLANIAGDTQLNGQGTTSRTTSLNTVLTARVISVLPNGGLVVEASKDIQVNSEYQTITVRGVIRPADIDNTNSVQSSRLGQLEVRINGKGVVNDAIKRPFFLYRLLLGLLPF
ncbi:MAG TPA: flagellar basal body L-ring protein FlgH [Bryobacteraceae bacterium]|jgi:flagellar L-ring protein precursor FlgH|nr:flagellar basal body L-ring protein FlgH [Bryobacteraceae bacterium]